ncbi:hypothetical protein GGR51DRAFT_524740 [Nemania sp. FL0031]|nr:hypothetical protein GGR51DRAFT_524740 [Nemania sp. FL0031]
MVPSASAASISTFVTLYFAMTRSVFLSEIFGRPATAPVITNSLPSTIRMPPPFASPPAKTEGSGARSAFTSLLVIVCCVLAVPPLVLSVFLDTCFAELLSAVVPFPQLPLGKN